MNDISRHDLAEWADNFRLRVIQDTLNEATETYWLRRAATLETVGTPWADEAAQACRNAATLAPLMSPQVTA